ncbi:hypothetical protein METBIDRAFT_39895 [Metschnikowia bicuspidata var. bicuspidata NRRL YB-4993]|uniref:Protein YIP n=1 Tax=Metschnikowia bicuspidata var. bicuspidata NRRL YB-4993 TaxID=869754 RepID=A0A1A0HFF6_9ASCO|nr:hypothetical protein METBIDRAFT_39895 [Metschnikowia bicuspidata var. bicuspidata NRRL YB-4993]OBA22598.1 hypothetical protein METBIDRAFT_39895 [Metschnikowia bicuspidata var. bicuspidata NRRL YB-4993]
MSWLDPENNDYIIPDEPAPEPAAPAGARGRGAHNHSPGTETAAPGFPWTPAVDLLAAFTPFFAPKTGPAAPRVSERRFAGGDTLDEPILETLKRDMLQIGRRVAAVVWPAQLQTRLAAVAAAGGPVAAAAAAEAPGHVTHEAPGGLLPLDWDLWGPLVFLLAYAVTMGAALPAAQTNMVFSGTFLLMWMFYLVVGFNVQLLGGTVSFLAAISAAGYLMFPLVAGALVSTAAVPWRMARLVVMAFCAVWSIYAASVCLRCLGVLPGRLFLAIYPVTLMYAVLAWLVVIT